MADLASKDLPSLSRRCSAPERQRTPLAKQVKGWSIVNEHHITKSFAFPDFKSALAFVNKVGELAESQGHHPDLLLSWGKAEVTTWTHKIDGLTETDFILAAKIDEL